MAGLGDVALMNLRGEGGRLRCTWPSARDGSLVHGSQENIWWLSCPSFQWLAYNIHIYIYTWSGFLGIQIVSKKQICSANDKCSLLSGLRVTWGPRKPGWLLKSISQNSSQVPDNAWFGLSRCVSWMNISEHHEHPSAEYSWMILNDAEWCSPRSPLHHSPIPMVIHLPSWPGCVQRAGWLCSRSWAERWQPVVWECPIWVGFVNVTDPDGPWISWFLGFPKTWRISSCPDTPGFERNCLPWKCNVEVHGGFLYVSTLMLSSELEHLQEVQETISAHISSYQLISAPLFQSVPIRFGPCPCAMPLSHRSGNDLWWWSLEPFGSAPQAV